MIGVVVLCAAVAAGTGLAVYTYFGTYWYRWWVSRRDDR